MNLFEIDAEIRAALEAIENAIDENGEIVDADAFATLEALKKTQAEKFENIAIYIKELEATADAQRAEARKLTERARSNESHASRLKNYLVEAMQRGDIKKFDGVRANLALRASQSVVIDDLDKLPAEFISYEKKANKADLKQYLKTAEIDGAHLEDKQNLIIK